MVLPTMLSYCKELVVCLFDVSDDHTMLNLLVLSRTTDASLKLRFVDVALPEKHSSFPGSKLKLSNLPLI